MSPKSRNPRRRSGDNRWGYRASPQPPHEQLLPHQEGQEERQRLLDKIRFDSLQRGWRSDRIEKGREGWHSFGNKFLPIEQYRHDIMKMIAINRISLLAGETGSGKSTQLAQYALEMGYDRIVYLQPRRVTTDNIADRLEYELSKQFDERGIAMPKHLVGMSHSERATLHDDSIIQVMTSAVFKKRAPELQETWQNERVLIVADEVHEGNIETEFAVATAAEMMTEQTSWNMVLMSATMNEQEIQEAYAPLNGRKIPQIMVEGRPHNIRQHERAQDTVVDVFMNECLSQGNKTLIFTDGKRSLGAIEEELTRRCGSNIRVLLLHSKIDEVTRSSIFKEPDAPGVHTVIISTSAGQSGLTIPGVDRVISDGWTKSPELDEENASGLPRRLCSRAELTQQMGRGGRDVDGAEFFLARALPYSKRPGAPADLFVPFGSHKREEHIPADIYHTVITRNVLSAAAMDRDFYTLNEFLIHKVTHGTIKEAYSILQLLGATDSDNEVTDIGRRMDLLPLRPELARTVVESEEYGEETLLQVLAIAAAIEAGGMAGYNQSQDELRKKILSSDTKDDFTAELDLFLAARRLFVHEEDSKEPNESQDSEDSEDSNDALLGVAGLDAINAIRAHKQFRKMCRRLEIEDGLSKLTNGMTVEHRKQLQELFLVGMPHLLYEEMSRKRRRGRQTKLPDGTKKPPKIDVWYRSILGPPKGETYRLDRQVGSRSILASQLFPQGSMIAGYPRWYETDEEGRVNIIERGFPTTKGAVRRVLGHRALDLNKYTEVGPDGRLRLITQSYIGNLRVSRHKTKDRATSTDKAELLAARALERPGSAQREVRRLKRMLSELAERVPVKQHAYYFERPPISETDLVMIVRQAADKAGSTGELDANIREMGIYTQQYITDEKRLAIEKNMPAEIKIDGSSFRLHYEGDNAQPYIIEFPLDRAVDLPEHLFVPDGREILFRYKYDADDVRVLSAGEVREMASNVPSDRYV